MNDKKVLILGATSDVGKALAQVYAEQHFQLVLAARNVKDLEPIKSDFEIRNEAKVEIAEFEATDYSSHPAFIDKVGTPDICICVFGYLGDQTEAENNWDEAKSIMSINYIGAASILEEVAKKMTDKKTGTIVGISSVAGERGRQSNYFYGSSKAGFTAYLSGLRNRLFHKGIHVLTVKPGFIDTKMTAGMDLPKPLTASPLQVAKAIAKAARKKKNTIYVLSMWRLIMYIIKTIPEGIFKKLKL
ncbi:SDR family oxidoreductase [Fulvivirga lutimaris]|uniref:SDR family oxidoreductase n=1 Tax=Fulvivirga lutimaris TaxID=1819566 RepID=UPI0012BD1F02|nr:SDR family oxidoreductase [Fulvivirga lutimaris]MTI38749.1 SDR family oxidoreductase [Fulvivirga lutimaris]